MRINYTTAYDYVKHLLKEDSHFIYNIKSNNEYTTVILRCHDVCITYFHNAMIKWNFGGRNYIKFDVYDYRYQILTSVLKEYLREYYLKELLNEI